jgi:MYXO-CTERM domain-containing protein
LPEEIVMKPQSRSSFSLRGLGAALTLVGALLLAPRAARAHIKMSMPADWITTNSEGDPQKITPCGVDPTLPAPVPPTATGVVTTLHVGDKVVFNWTETVPHDGHFRIALAINSRSELTDPAVTKANSDGTAAEVAISTAYPVLADNLFVHTAASVSPGKAYTYTVTIPNTPCAKCTLQLLQFMANHPLDPSYFYHQCADVTILAAGGGTGGSSGATGGSSGAAGKTGGTSGATTGTGGTISGTGGTTAGTGGAISGTGGATTGTGGTTTGTGGRTASGTGGTPAGSGGTGATGSGGTGTGGSPEGGSGGGCACQLGAANGKLTGLGLLGVALICVRRRRRAR